MQIRLTFNNRLMHTIKSMRIRQLVKSIQLNDTIYRKVNANQSEVFAFNTLYDPRFLYSIHSKSIQFNSHSGQVNANTILDRSSQYKLKRGFRIQYMES